MKRSAGLLLYRHREGSLEVLIAHMGGPFWAARDEHAWSIPKGEYDSDEDPLQAARREFTEELGLPVPDGEEVALGSLTLHKGKTLTVWALRGDLDVSQIKSNTFELRWPRGSGEIREFPEVDRAEWVALESAVGKLTKGQSELPRLLTEHLQSHTT